MLRKINEDFNEKEIQDIQRKFEKGLLLSKSLKNRGLGTSDFENLVEIFLKRKYLDWKKVLRETISEIKAQIKDYNLLKQSKKAQLLRNVLNKDIFIPDLRKEEENVNVIIGIDVSGSISDNDYGEFINEIYNLLTDTKAKGYIILWDTEIKKVIEIKNGWKNDIFENLKLRKGYGGTLIKSFFDKVNELIKSSKKKVYLVILTDGYTENVEKEWTKSFKKVIFVISKNGTKDTLKEVKNESNVIITEMV